MSFTNLNEQFHIFSKSPVRSGQTLGSARNKSGHTVTSADIWADEIPAMFYAYTTAQKNTFETIASENDLCYDKQTDTLYYCKDKKWVNRSPLSDQEIIFNSKSATNGIYNDGSSHEDNSADAVIRYHKDKPANAITADNNNQSAGNGLTARIKKSDGTFISQFVSSMDKMVQGNPSSLYEPVVIYKGNTMEEAAEDTTERKYISNSYSGIIQFHNTLSTNSLTGDYVDVSVSVFEYIGKKLDNTLSKISFDLNSEKSDKGISIKQSNGLIESLLVNHSTVNEDGSLNEETKNNVITGSEVQKMIDNVISDFSNAGVKYQIVDNLPMPPKANYHGTVYLVPATQNTSENNYYNEFICIDKDENTWAWEQIGTTKVDLSDYVSKDDLAKSDAIVWDLNDFVVKHANVGWVQEMINSDITFIPHRTTFYPTSTSMADAKNQWIQEAITNGKVSVQLVFPLDSYQTNEIIRQMFWQLDADNGVDYTVENSISKKYLKPGLTVKYFTFLEDGNWLDHNDTDYDTILGNIDEDTEGKTYYPSYVYQTWIGKTKVNNVDYNWGQPNWNGAMRDSFMPPYNWTSTSNEQQIKILKKFILDNKNEIEQTKSKITSSKLCISTNNCDSTIHSVITSPTWGDVVGEIKLSKQFFTTGKIDSIIIPHDYDTQWSNNTYVHLFVEVFNSTNTKLGTFISANKEVYSENLRYSFIFENCTIPEEYAYVKLSTSSTDNKSKRDYQPFRVVPLRDKNNQNKETNRIESPDCYFGWISNGVLSGGVNRIANVITSRNINNEVQTDITTNKEEDANSLSTTQAIKDFVNEQITIKSLTEIIEGDFIEVDYGNVVSVSTSKKISDNSKTVPTTKAVFDELNPHVTNDKIHLTEELHETIDELVVAEEYNDFVFDLSNIFFKYINKDWVEKIVILSIDTNSASPYKEYGIVVPGDIDIPYYEKFYPDSDSIYLELNNLQISDTPPAPTINAVGFDLSDVAKSAISEKIIQLSRIFWSKTKNGTITETIQNDFNVEVNKLKKSVPLKARWITDAKNGICKAPLSFQGSTHRRNEILRTFFYYLDQENGKTYAASDSYSRKYMRPGLTVKCMVAPDELVKPNKGNMTDEQYNDKYMYYTYTYFTFIGDRNRNIPLVNWQYVPSYLTIGWQPGYGYASTNESNGSAIPNENTTHPNRMEDAFSNGGCWSYLANEQKFYCLQTTFRELELNKLGEIVAGDCIIVEDKNKISVNTSDSIVDDSNTVPTSKAVFKEIDNLKNGYLEEVLVSEEYNDFVFDLSNIFYEQIGQPWAESILLLSGDCIEIPYKEYYYPNAGTLTITGITNGENPSTPVIQTSGFTLSEVGRNVITEKLIKEAKNGRVEQTIAALQADVPYKAQWIADAKNKNIPTQVAFERVGNYVRATANEVLRMVFYNLDKQYGKQWGGDGSFSKKYIVPGLTYKCFTGPDKTFVSDNPDDENNYYTYCHNTWLGNLGGKTFAGSQGVTRYFEFNWNYIPDYLSFESILNQTGNRDVFRDPNYWDTTINEQQWDSMLIDHNNIKEKINSTEDEINAINENIDSVRQMIVETKYNTVYNSDISSSATSGSSTKTIAGVIFEPQSNVSTSKIEMRGITNPNSEVFHESFLYIWEDSTVDGETRVITSIQNPSKGKQNKIDKNTYEWGFKTPFQFISGKTYYITWHSACRENAISPPNTPEKGYTPTFETYQLSTVSTGGVYVLNNDVQYFNNENIDRTTTVDLRLYQESGEYEMRFLEKETVYPEASNNVLISQTTSQEGSLRGGYGIGFISNKTSKLDKIIIRGITNGSHTVQDAYAKIWKGETGEFVAASKFAVKPTVDEGETKQLIISSDNFADVTLEFNTLYLITFHDNRNEHSYETGYQWNYNCYQQNSDKFGIISGGGKQIQLDKTISPKVEIYSQSTTCIFIRPEDLSEIIEDISESIDDKIIDIIEEIEETETKISLEKFDDSFGLASNNNSNSKSCGIIIKVPETKKYNKISVYAKGINEGNDNSIGVKTWMILHEVQSDGSVKELCTSVENQNNAVTFSGNLEQRTYSFDTFTMYSDKTYYCEFVEKNEDGSIKEARPIINVGLFNKDSSLQHLQLTEVLGIISSSYRNKGTWNKIYTSGSSIGEYTACYKLEHTGNDIIHLRPVKNNVYNSNIILAGSSMVSTCSVDALFDSSKSEICIEMKDYQFDENGEDYLIIKTFYVDKETNTSGEIIQHHAIQNVLN